MTDKNKKMLILNTLLLFFGILVITIYSVVPQETLKEPETFLVNFDSDGGSSIAAITIEEGTNVNQPIAPTKEGYVFIGWMLDNELYDFSQGINGDITLKAGWKVKQPDKIYYTVVFDTMGGSIIANQVIEEGQLASRPSSYPTKEGYNFAGWKYNDADYDFSMPVNSNITIVASWEKIDEPVEPDDPTPPEEDKTFTVRFNGNGGTLGNGCGNQTIKSGETARNSCSASRSGYTFVGFNTNRNATTALNIASRRITANTTYYAIWKQNTVTPKPNTYIVSFNANGGTYGSNCPSPGSGKNVNQGTSLSSICTVSRNHYTFVSWTLNGRQVSTATSDGTYTASWRLNTFKVGCDEKGDTLTNMTCAPFVTENGRRISNVKIKLPNGSVLPATINKKLVWDKNSSFKVEVDGIEVTAGKVG